MLRRFLTIAALVFLFACGQKNNETSQNPETTTEVVENEEEEKTQAPPAEPKNVVFEKLDAVGYKMKIMQIGTAKKVEQRKMLILDVRTGIDFGKAHIKDAVNIDQNAADFKELVEKQLDKQIPVFVYAENDEKSLAAGELLKSMNFRAVFVLEGGFPSWQKENYEVVFAM